MRDRKNKGKINFKAIKEQSKKILKKVVFLILNPRFLLCFGIAWLITNGWAYALIGLGTIFKIGWMIAVASAYLALLWVPFTPEKIITVMLAIVFLKFLFPNDEKTLGQLRALREKIKTKKKEYKEKKEKGSE
ncbi:MAG: hypothetical protein IJ470_00120 [Clostridia bacterium]|nr:hypothetical protein [Clostridia bacterium]